jgi:prevent-host-death family protein
MYEVGARELKQHTGAIIARVKRGERVLLTLRGDPVAVISPIDRAALDEVLQREVEKAESLGWLAVGQAAFDFWDNDDDAVWDEIEPT